MPAPSSVCLKCGAIAKSGKVSCCGRGGSWFGNCGSALHAKLDHSWYEGIRSCKALRRSKSVVGRRSGATHLWGFSGVRSAIAAATTTSSTVFTGITATSAAFATNASFTSAITTGSTTTVTAMTAVTLFRVGKESAISTDWFSQGACYAHDVSVLIYTSCLPICVCVCVFEHLNRYPLLSTYSLTHSLTRTLTRTLLQL